mgnify:FL=1|jgi:hypothetical protein
MAAQMQDNEGTFVPRLEPIVSGLLRAPLAAAGGIR